MTMTMTMTMASAVLEWLKDNVFTSELVDDERTLEGDALVSAAIPTWITGGSVDDDDYGDGNVVCGLLPPDIRFYLQIGPIVLFQSAFNAVLAVGMYAFVIEPQQRHRRRRRIRRAERPDDDENGDGMDDPSPTTTTTSSSSAVLFALGIALPLVALKPILAVRYLGIRNLGLVMVFLSTPIANSLKILEGLAGYAPAGSTTSLKSYVMYFSCIFGMEFEDDEKGENPKRTTVGFVLRRLASMGRDFVKATILISILKPRGYELLPPYASSSSAHASAAVDSMDHTLSELISVRHLINNFLVASLICASVSQASIGVSLIYNVLYGVQTYEIFRNPMTLSRSVTDFWGRRWNLLIHNGLKRGVYKPVRRETSSKGWAAVATFVASGLLHEYVNFVMFGDYHHDDDGGGTASASASGWYRFRWKQMIFFGWNGILMVGEYAFGDTPAVRWMSETLPGPLVTVLVLSLALPLAHLFTGDWIRGGFFDDLSFSEFMVVCERQRR